MESKKHLADFEWKLRPIAHRTFGPGQASAFVMIEDPRFRQHRACDITVAALRIATEIGPPYLTRSHTDIMTATFSRNFVLTYQRKMVHLGAGLRTPDGRHFVSFLLKDESKKNKHLGMVYEWPAVGKVRAESEVAATECRLWDHKQWAIDYPNYQEWLDRLLWKTDPSTNRPIPPDDHKVIKGADVDDNDLPDGWPYRAHRDDKALRAEYRKAGSKL